MNYILVQKSETYSSSLSSSCVEQFTCAHSLQLQHFTHSYPGFNLECSLSQNMHAMFSSISVSFCGVTFFNCFFDHSPHFPKTSIRSRQLFFFGFFPFPSTKSLRHLGWHETDPIHFVFQAEAVSYHCWQIRFKVDLFISSILWSGRLTRTSAWTCNIIDIAMWVTLLLGPVRS
jgi:hypothetical protein